MLTVPRAFSHVQSSGKMAKKKVKMKKMALNEFYGKYGGPDKQGVLALPSGPSGA